MIRLRTLALAFAAAFAWQAPALAESHSEATMEEMDTAVVEMVLGAEDAAVTVIEYASYTCPHCADFHNNQFKQLKTDFIDTGKVRFIYRDVYFDRVGLWASMVARCEPDRFFGVSNLIYQKQDEWLDSQDPATIAESLRKLGKVAGLEEDKIQACLEDADKAKALVDWFQANAEADSIRSTPTLIIDGEQHSNMSYDKLKALLDEKLGS